MSHEVCIKRLEVAIRTILFSQVEFLAFASYNKAMFAKVLLICSVLVAVHATGVVFVNTGVSSTSRTQNEDGSYSFNYEIADAKGATNSRSEVGDAHGNKKGSYSLHDTDGRDRQVDYIADNNGYRAVVKTNEPGTALSAPAAAVIDSPYRAPVAPEVPVQAPEPVVVAPVSHPAPATTTKLTIVHDVPVAHPAPVVVAPVAHPAPIVVAPVAHPAPVVVAPVAHPVPVATTHFSSTVVHGNPVVFGFPRRLVAPLPISLGFGIAPYGKVISAYKGTPFYG